MLVRHLHLHYLVITYFSTLGFVIKLFNVPFTFPHVQAGMSILEAPGKMITSRISSHTTRQASTGDKQEEPFKALNFVAATMTRFDCINSSGVRRVSLLAATAKLFVGE